MKKILSHGLAMLSCISVIAQESAVISTLKTYNIETGHQKIIRTEVAHFEAPNWSADGTYFIINQDGSLYTVSMEGEKEKIATGSAVRCNNDHVISPDGKILALSNNLEGGQDGWLTSCIFTMPIEGGEPTRITKNVPSFLHGWSPDGKMLTYTALRNDQFDIYTIPSRGGQEIQLTNSKGLSDGSEYSVDGKHIYYNAMDSGKMEIWRMDSDGKNKKQLTDDAYSNWFPHVSPDGRHFVFISYLQDQGGAHPPMKQVALRLYTINDKSVKTLHTFTGGQGSLNVPSWSPDGKEFAYVSYEYKNKPLQYLAELDTISLNALSDFEAKNGWQLLFNGKNFTGWHGFNTSEAPDSWVITDGAMEMLTDVKGPLGLTTDNEYESFVLSLEFKVSEGANSGILFQVAENEDYKFAYETGSEYQVIDHEGWKEPLEDWQICGANYAMYAPKLAAHKPAGEWNHALLIVDGNTVTQVLNGKVVVAYEKYSDEWKKLRNSGKWADFPDYGKYDKGHIVFQHYGDNVFYRNIKIKQLN